MIENIGMSIGERVRLARKSKGLTQKELAEKTGIKQPTLSELEHGESKGTAHIARIASVLQVSALWLETGRGTREGVVEVLPAAWPFPSSIAELQQLGLIDEVSKFIAYQVAMAKDSVKQTPAKQA